MASPSNDRSTLFVAGDIGGTNTRLMLLRRRIDDEALNCQGSVLENGLVVEVVLAQETYPSQEYPTLTAIVELFLLQHGGRAQSSQRGDEQVSVCVFAVAGPVEGNKSNITNLNWFLDGDQMARELGVPSVVLLNDFAAIGYGLLDLGDDDFEALGAHRQPARKHGAPIACLGAGTGLGEVFLTYNGREYDVWPSEGGHTSFAPRNDIEYRLLKYLRTRFDLPTVSTERVCSGSALVNMYEFLAHEYPQLVKPSVHRAIMEPSDGQDPVPIISKHALNDSDPLCVMTLDMFVKIYGAEAGDLALKTLPFGGLYIAGGVAPKILPLMKKQGKFLENMNHKGRMRPLLEKIPVYVVLHKHVGLLGSRVIARRILRDTKGSGKQVRRSRL